MTPKKRILVPSIEDGSACTHITETYQSDTGIEDEEKEKPIPEDWTIPEDYYE